MKSNFFQTKEDTHVLEAVGFRDLGNMIFNHQNCALERKKEIAAVITPFEIVDVLWEGRLGCGCGKLRGRRVPGD